MSAVILAEAGGGVQTGVINTAGLVVGLLGLLLTLAWWAYLYR
jgi:hypothetical protein